MTVARPANRTVTTLGFGADDTPGSLGHDLAGSGDDVTFTYTYNRAKQVKTLDVSNAAYLWHPYATRTVAYTPKALNRLASVGGDAACTYVAGTAPISYAGADADALSWQRLGLGAYQVVLKTGVPCVTARLLRIPAGRPVSEHSHKGLELTLVLAGAFDDCTGHYGRGDFQEADDNLVHQPHAAPGEDSITEPSLRFTEPVVRLIQPLLKRALHR